MRFTIRISATLTCAFVALGVLSPAAGARQHRTPPALRDGVQTSRGTHELSIALDAAGVEFVPGTTNAQIEEFENRNRLRAATRLSGLLYTYSLAQPAGREALTARARGLARDSIVRAAGLLATPAGASVPMVLTDEFVVRFDAAVGANEIARRNERHGAGIVAPDPFVPNQFVLRATGKADALTLSNRYRDEGGVLFAHPNFVVVIDLRTVPNDPLFGNQWQHVNAGGTDDADIDTDLAWDITRGSPDVTIAAVDNGFELTHEYLAPNVAFNTAETANGRDDDGNGFVDDLTGWDFRDNDNQPVPNPALDCGRPVPAGCDTRREDNHGTAVAGMAAARGDNMIGVSGSCPRCTFLPVRAFLGAGSVAALGNAFDYSRTRGAEIITNSWGFPTGVPSFNTLSDAITRATDAGIVVLFAMNNPNIDDCGLNPDISSLPNVIAVSRSNTSDRFDRSGYGDCMDVLAPAPGTWTTDRTGAVGYSNQNYAGFSGTSAATPLAAGVVGLMLSANPRLDRTRIQEILQDTADKIEPDIAAYGATTGFSGGDAAAALPMGGRQHGFGRINAFEAVRLARSLNRDLFLRDNNLDWGNISMANGSGTRMEAVRRVEPVGNSPDIKIDAPPFQLAPRTDDEFDALVHETAIAGTANKVFVRARNRAHWRGWSHLKLFWANTTAGFPVLPDGFWSDPTPFDSRWTRIGHTDVNAPYSAATAARAGTDAPSIVQFWWTAPGVGVSTTDVPHTLLAVLDSPADPVGPRGRSTADVEELVRFENNAAMKNVGVAFVIAAPPIGPAPCTVCPLPIPIPSRPIVIDRPLLPKLPDIYQLLPDPNCIVDGPGCMYPFVMKVRSTVESWIPVHGPVEYQLFEHGDDGPVLVRRGALVPAGDIGKASLSSVEPGRYVLVLKGSFDPDRATLAVGG